MENGSSQQPQTPANWQFTPEGSQSANTDLTSHHDEPETVVEWTASEFVAHHKNTNWYAALAFCTFAGAGIIYLLTKDLITVGMIFVVAAIFGIFAARKPRTLNYRLDTSGIHIDAKSYAYNLYKSFSIIDEGAISSIRLSPMKRFMPPLSMYYDPKDEDKIADVLNNYMPFEEKSDDVIDSFMRRIRF